MAERIRSQQGQAVLLALAAVAFAAVLAAGVVRLGVVVAQRGSVQAAADAVALAGASAGPEAAREVAAANHVEVVSLAAQGTDVLVTVERGAVHASARARWQARSIP